jgi:NAD(P)-dependent dehydrogenase (short-subunit alcohol dehydrogenase family)
MRSTSARPKRWRAPWPRRWRNGGASTRSQRAPEFAEADWDYVIDTNLKGLFLTAKYTIGALASSGGGSIVTVSSVNAVASSRMIPAYSASKGGIVSMTRTLALDHAPDGIRVNCILPGSVDTSMLRASANRRFPDDPQAAIDEWGRKHPLGRVLSPDEVGNAIVFLLSSRASGITGATLAVDGGLTAVLAL